MSYRPLNKRQRDERARRLEAMQRGKERARMARPLEVRAPELPLLRREVVIIDYDTGAPVPLTHHRPLRLYFLRTSILPRTFTPPMIRL